MRVGSAAALCIVGLLAATVAVASPATATPSPTQPNTPSVVHKSATVTESTVATARRAPGITPSTAAAVTPPPTCKQDLTLKMNWTYENGVLTTTTAEADSTVSCVPAHAGQTMQSLSTVNGLVKNAKSVKTPATKQHPCTYHGTDPCTIATGDLFYVCGGASCSGYYLATATATETLPTGYIWASYPSSCTPLNAKRTIICAVYTDPTIHVAPSG